MQLFCVSYFQDHCGLSAGSCQGGCTMLRTSIQDGGFRLDNLKSTLTDISRSRLFIDASGSI